MERERGKPAFALMAERGTGRYVGSPFITLNREKRDRLWKRVQEHAGPAPKGDTMGKATDWPREALARGRGLAPCCTAGLPRGRRSIAVRTVWQYLACDAGNTYCLDGTVVFIMRRNLVQCIFGASIL